MARRRYSHVQPIQLYAPVDDCPAGKDGHSPCLNAVGVDVAAEKLVPHTKNLPHHSGVWHVEKGLTSWSEVPRNEHDKRGHSLE